MIGWHQIAACLLAITVTALNLAPLELQRRIVNEVVDTRDVDLLVQLGGIYVALILLHQGAKYTLRMYQGWLIESTIRYVRNHLIRIYTSSDERANTQNDDRDSSGRAVSIVSSEVEKLGGFVGESLSQACANAAMLVGVATYMLVVEPKIALFALAVVIPQIILTPVIQKRLNALVETRVGLMRKLADDITELGPDACNNCLDTVPDIYQNRMTFYLLKFAMKSALNLLNAVGPIVVLLYGGYLVMQGDTEVGVIVAFLSGFDRLSGPIRELIALYRIAAQAGVQHRLIAKWIRQS